MDGDAGDRSIVAVDAATGNVKWKGQYGGQATADFAVSDSALYVPVGGDLVVLDRRTGMEVQRIRRGDAFTSSVVGSPTYADGRVYVVANNAVLCFKER